MSFSDLGNYPVFLERKIPVNLVFTGKIKEAGDGNRTKKLLKNIEK